MADHSAIAAAERFCDRVAPRSTSADAAKTPVPMRSRCRCEPVATEMPKPSVFAIPNTAALVTLGSIHGGITSDMCGAGAARRHSCKLAGRSL